MIKILSNIWKIIYKHPTRKIRVIFNKYLKRYLLPSIKTDLLIVDNFEPSWLATGFRVKEFIWLLNTIKNSKLLTFSNEIFDYNDWKYRAQTGEINWNFPLSRKEYKQNKKIYSAKFNIPQSKFCYMRYRKYKAKYAYIMFLYNAYLSQKLLERNKIPFTFTLYPGGGLRLNHDFSDCMLKSVFSSSMFRGVFVPQKIIYDYLIEKKLCPKDKIYFSYGGGFFQFEKRDVKPKLWYKKDKKTFDICFVAFRYMPKGLDKGFDLFIHIAKKIVKKYPFIHFHNVGTHTLEDFDEDFSDIQNNLHFYGSQTRDFFPDFYSKMDMVLSPNRPNLLDKGAFDGFPLSVDGMYFGAPLLCTDELKMNHNYVSDKELIIIKPNIDDIILKIEFYLKHLNELHNIAKKGQQKVQKLFDIEYQQNDRKTFLKKYLGIDMDK